MTLSQHQQEAREKFDIMIENAPEKTVGSDEISSFFHGIIASAFEAGKAVAVKYIEAAFSESRPKTELNISELFREARNAE